MFNTLSLQFRSLSEITPSPDPKKDLTVWLYQLTLAFLYTILKLALEKGTIFVNLSAKPMRFAVYPLTLMVVSRDMESSSYAIWNPFACDLPKVVSIRRSPILIEQWSKSNCFSTIEEEFTLFCEILNIHRSVNLPTIVSFSADCLNVAQFFTHYLV